MKKIFLTVLGTGGYSDCFYYQDEKEIRTKFIQEALIRLILRKDSDNEGTHTSEDDFEVKVLLTQKAYNKNYIRNDDTKGESLEEVFNRIKINPDLIMIPEGKNETELWDIFDNTIKSIKNCEENTEIILDITHSLRNIPVQILVALNYAKLFNNINLSGIYYGAFELGYRTTDPLNENVQITHAPICNLNVYYELLNWTNALNSFDKTGNASQIISIYNEKRKNTFKFGTKEEQNNLKTLTNVIKSIEDFTKCINTCRGMLLDDPKKHKYSSKSIGTAANKLATNIDNLSENITIKPLIPLFSVIREKVEPFLSDNNLQIGIATVKWCIDYDLFEQGYTALEETTKTFLCEKLNLDSVEYKNREDIANTILNCINVEEQSTWRIKQYLSDNEKQLIISTTTYLSTNDRLKKLIDGIKNKRNDINHFGFKKDSLSNYDSLHRDLEKYYKEFLEIKETIEIPSMVTN